MRAGTGQFGFQAASLALLGSLVLAGCSEQVFRGRDPIPVIQEFAMHYNKTGKYCGATQPLRLVVRDAGHMAFVPVSDVPVDFDKEMVLFVTMGQVYSDAYGIRIDRVWQQNQTLKVGITVTHPEPGEMGAPQPCSPYYLAVVPRSDLNIEGFVTEVAAPSLQGPGLLPGPKKQYAPRQQNAAAQHEGEQSGK